MAGHLVAATPVTSLDITLETVPGTVGAVGATETSTVIVDTGDRVVTMVMEALEEDTPIIVMNTGLKWRVDRSRNMKLCL